MSQQLLIVDDDPFILDVYRDLFLDEGYKVDTASDGQEGYEKIRLGGYDGILLDVMMPHLDAIEILKCLQDHPPEQSNGPIIVLTNLNHDPAIKKALEYGAFTSLVKADHSPGELVNQVRSIIRKK
jgi:DNA-binding response OmpR family regulator